MVTTQLPILKKRSQHARQRAWCESTNFRSGFTLIELLVVLAIIALLATLAVPRYFQHLDTAREAVLIQNLRMTRDMLDKFNGDRGRYPLSLNELVDKKYLKSVPFDPITESTTTWIIVPPEEATQGAVQDIKSGATGTNHAGVLFSEL
jgi:general secretion pathway protein G